MDELRHGTNATAQRAATINIVHRTQLSCHIYYRLIECGFMQIKNKTANNINLMMKSSRCAFDNQLIDQREKA